MKRASCSAVILLLMSTGCVHNRNTDTQPSPVAAAPETAKAAPAERPPASTSKPKPAPVTTSKTAPATKGQTAPPSAKAPATKPQTAASPTRPAAAPPLDLAALKTQLKQTKAIGLMTKLSLKNQVDDLLDEFRKHHAGKTTPTVADLRRSYDLLMMKVLSLLQDHDQRLASDIVSSRERIWGLLVNPRSFAALQA